jgi:serine phosphatase RsbU (regulator of sigma subunit)
VVPFKLVEGDTLLLMTDGVAEAQNAAGQLFGFARIEEMVRTGAAASALASAAQAFGQEDDITVLTVRSVAAYA